MGNDFLLERFGEFGTHPALLRNHRPACYCDVLERMSRWKRVLEDKGIQPGECVALRGDYSLDTVTLFLTLAIEGQIAVPLASVEDAKVSDLCELACVTRFFDFRGEDVWNYAQREAGDHELLQRLRGRGEAGLVLFSSGSTGEVKASLLSFSKLLARYEQWRRSFRTLAFLLFDHIGGVNTLLHSLCNGGLIVVPDERTPPAICRLVERHRVQLLPATPTFLNMLLMSEAYQRFDLSSLQMITYGAECMPPATLQALGEVLPHITFKQTYGLTELGILPTQSENQQSLWIKMGGYGYEVKTVDGVVCIRGITNMEGYLNAALPFDDEGWFNTGDMVEERGGYMRIVGRKSEIINVGVQKVFPIEVENVLLQVENVKDAVVRGRPNPVVGQVVTARVSLFQEEEPSSVEERIREFCRGRLATFKIPVLIEISEEPLHGRRFKRTRGAD